MKLRNDQRGFVLVLVLVLMVIMTLLGITVIDFSTIDLQITGNQKRVSIALEGADAGLDLSIPIIEKTLADGALDSAGITASGVLEEADIDTTNLLNEITGQANLDPDTASATPDLKINNLGGVEVSVDIDRLLSDILAGGSLEFASGYEGIGAGAAGGGISVLYRVTSQGDR